MKQRCYKQFSHAALSTKCGYQLLGFPPKILLGWHEVTAVKDLQVLSHSFPTYKIRLTINGWFQHLPCQHNTYFPRLDSSPLWPPCGSYCACLIVLLSHQAPTAHTSTEEFFPPCLFHHHHPPPPINLGSRPVGPWEDWKACLSCPLHCLEWLKLLLPC